jgi:type IV pilus assembly protein PilB
MPKLGVPVDSARQIAGLLVSFGLIDEDQFNNANTSSNEGEKCLIETLIDFGFTDEKTIANVISDSYDIEFIDTLDSNNIDFSASGILPKTFITENRVAPIRIKDNDLDVVISEPSALNQLQSVGLSTDKNPKPFLVTFSQFNIILENLNSESSSLSSKKRQKIINGSKPLKKVQDAEDKSSQDKYSSAANTFVEKSITKAIKMNVSDIHLERFRDFARMRFRLDGVLIEQKEAGKVLFENYAAIVAIIKIRAELDIAERRKSQDGGISFKVDNKNVDLRISVMPTKDGERVVMRILDTESKDFSIEKLGFQEDGEEAFIKKITQPQGMVLVTGPTGSGKSTTLYAALEMINDVEKNILTAEDPVEMQMDGIGQVHVKEDFGMTFSAALRSFLRQDPEVVMVGEIRDKETVDIAIKAALTGHLVLSTLHTNDAVSTVTRLMNMGVAPYLITASLTLVVAQRLARKNCSNCIQEDESVNPSQLRAIGFSTEESSSVRLYHGKGCRSCNRTGYSGRKGIYEVLTITDNLIEGILKELPTPELLKIAKEKDNFSTMQEVARGFLQEGDISLKEYKRVLILNQ